LLLVAQPRKGGVKVKPDHLTPDAMCLVQTIFLTPCPSVLSLYNQILVIPQKFV